MTREHLPCAMCERFDTTKHPQQAAAGLGRCTGFDQPGQPEAFVAWDNAPCVLFKEARERAPRARYVAQQQDNNKNWRKHEATFEDQFQRRPHERADGEAGQGAVVR